MFTFLWPWALLLLALIPFGIWWYQRALRPAAKSVLAYPHLQHLAQVQKGRRRLKRLLPALFYALACLLALLALARPTMPMRVADPLGGIILALDTSRSMQQQDIQPSRFEAAREAIRSFVAELPQGTRVGLVSFGAYAQLNIALTDNHEAFLETLNGMPLIRGTAIGEGLLTSLKALELAGGRPQSREDGSSLGSIVLLSDGNSRSGIAPLEALEDIKAQGVTVYTVGIGSTAGSLGQASFDESTLQAIAAETGGRYSFVASADDLRDVYRNLSQTIAWRWQADEATALLALCAALVLGVSLMMAQGSRRLF